MGSRTDDFNAAQIAVLERMAAGAPLAATLDAIVRAIEDQSVGMRCSILLLDPAGRVLRHGAAPSLPPDYVGILDGAAIGPEAGSCGASAARGEQIVIEDIATHPYWSAYRELALAHGLKACWSSPIRSSEGDVLGTFAMYYGEQRGPTPLEHEWVAAATHLAAIAIVRHRTSQARQEGEARANQLARLYAVSSAVSEALVRFRDPDQLYQLACRIPVDKGLAVLAWVGGYDAAADRILPLARHGAAHEYVDAIDLRLREPSIHRGPAATVIESGRLAIVNDIATDPGFHWRDEAVGSGLRSCAVFPLRLADGQPGILAMYGATPGIFRAEEIRVLGALADNVSFAVESASSEAERIRLVDVLGERVAELTLLHRVARCLQQDRPVDQVLLTELVALVPHGLRRPDVWRARIRWANLEVSAPGWRHSPTSVAVSLVGSGEHGALELVAVGDDVALRAEEHELLRSVADLLASRFGRDAAERDRRHNMALLRIAGRAARLGGWTLDVPNAHLVWSEELCAIHGVPAGTAPTVDEALDQVAVEDRECLRQAMLAAIHDGTPFDLEVGVLSRTGRRRVARMIGYAERDGSGAVVRVHGAMQDVDDRQRLEAELRQSQKMDAIGQLASGVAHDFNNLLSVILGYSELMMDELPTGAPLLADLQQIRRAGERAAELTRQLLAFSRREMVQPRVLDVAALLAGMEKMLDRLIGADIDLALLTAGARGRVLADPGQIEQVVVNLVVNARDAMPNGGKLTIEIEDVASADAEIDERNASHTGPYVLIAVSDTGVGMDRACRERLFEPFFTTKEPGKGTGLGLSTVFGIVRQSQGHIAVDSEVGAGTTFRVFLPLTDLPDAGTGAEPDIGSLRGSETILVVEDEEQVRLMARSILRRQGYTVLDAANGGEAFLLCEQFAGQIDLLLTDVVMPRMSGRALAERLALTRPQMRVIYISGYDRGASARSTELDGDVEFLQKPITPEALARRVRSVLDGADIHPVAYPP